MEFCQSAAVGTLLNMCRLPHFFFAIFGPHHWAGDCLRRLPYRRICSPSAGLPRHTCFSWGFVSKVSVRVKREMCFTSLYPACSTLFCRTKYMNFTCEKGVKEGRRRYMPGKKMNCLCTKKKLWCISLDSTSPSSTNITSSRK